MPLSSAIRLFVLCAIAGLSACGPLSAEEWGHRLFDDPALSKSPSNVVACSTCHAVEDQDRQIFAGYPLHGAAAIKNYWGGQYTLLSDAVRVCLNDFMRDGGALDLSSRDGLSLLAYLQSLPGPSTPRSMTVVSVIDAAYVAQVGSGDPARGQTLYAQACASCHGSLHTGRGRRSDRTPILPEATTTQFGDQARAAFLEKVRHGRYLGIGGTMPLYTREALPDPALADLVSYLLDGQN